VKNVLSNIFVSNKPETCRRLCPCLCKDIFGCKEGELEEIFGKGKEMGDWPHTFLNNSLTGQGRSDSYADKGEE
jgi:hypothetical protein